ncbi:outer membrane protein assembly factor BamC [Vibrio profundum]|uniref:outer membrane protein assembly factor BamC n=1 Tax=Vibrio profundum TaxID=2910247 RepID=UPI003D12DB3F
MKFTRQLVIGSLAVLFLGGCTDSPAQRREARGNFDYLTTPALKKWQEPADAKTTTYTKYQIPQGQFPGELGKGVDIRPPQQVLDFIPTAQVERKNGDAILWFYNQDEMNKVWQMVGTVLKEKQVASTDQADSDIRTDWVSFKSKDEPSVVSARYDIHKQQSADRFGIQFSLIEWRVGNEQSKVPPLDKARYTAKMTNLVTLHYDEVKRAEEEKKARELVKQIPISMGTDRSGLPVIIARVPYGLVWPQLPSTLAEMGFTVEDRNQSQGTIKVKYESPDSDYWKQLGEAPIDLKEGKYIFLFGDLVNRTSINLTTSAGKPVDEAVLKAMVPMFKEASKKHREK